MLSGSTDLLLDKVEQAFPEVAPSLVALCRCDDRDQPDFRGTGVLFSAGDSHFIISAAHVFDELVGGVFLLHPGGTEWPLQNSPEVPLAEGGDRQDDRLDVGFVRLEDGEAETIGKHRFLQPRNASPRDAAAPAMGYFVAGFPAKWERPDYSQHTLPNRLMRYAGIEAPARAYQYTHLTRDFHLALKFHPNRVKGPKGIGGAPDTHGMSGGGVWRINPLVTYGPDSKPYLVAIFI